MLYLFFFSFEASDLDYSMIAPLAVYSLLNRIESIDCMYVPMQSVFMHCAVVAFVSRSMRSESPRLDKSALEARSGWVGGGHGFQDFF